MSKFDPGQVVATPGALAALEASGESVFGNLTRHLVGDSGEVPPEDIMESEFGLKRGMTETSPMVQNISLMRLAGVPVLLFSIWYLTGEDTTGRLRVSVSHFETV